MAILIWNRKGAFKGANSPASGCWHPQKLVLSRKFLFEQIYSSDLPQSNLLRGIKSTPDAYPFRNVPNLREWRWGSEGLKIATSMLPQSRLSYRSCQVWHSIWSWIPHLAQLRTISLQIIKDSRLTYSNYQPHLITYDLPYSFDL